MLQYVSELDGFCGTTKTVERDYEMWNSAV